MWHALVRENTGKFISITTPIYVNGEVYEHAIPMKLYIESIYPREKILNKHKNENRSFEKKGKAMGSNNSGQNRNNNR